MSLLETRKWFIDTSGRYDLVVDNVAYVDDGADKYINAGSKFLDRLTEFKHQKARVFTMLESGKNVVMFQRSRVIQDVYVGTATEGLTKLELKTYDELKDLYATTIDQLDGGRPVYYMPAQLRGLDLDVFGPDGIVGFMDISASWLDYDGVILYPPSDQEYHVEVRGKFFSELLVADADENHWTKNEGNILNMSALRQLEITYRNTQGVNDWTNAINMELFGLEQDYVEEETNDINQMRG